MQSNTKCVKNHVSFKDTIQYDAPCRQSDGNIRSFNLQSVLDIFYDGFTDLGIQDTQIKPKNRKKMTLHPVKFKPVNHL